jgi:hypothetical protein
LASLFPLLLSRSPFVQKISPSFSFPALSFVPKKNSTSRPSLSFQKTPPFPAGVESSIYRLEGCGLLLRVGSRARGGWSTRQGAWGFKFWGQHAVIVSCFKGGHGALATCGKKNSVKTTLFSFLFFIHFFFKILTLFLFYLWGTQKWVTT